MNPSTLLGSLLVLALVASPATAQAPASEDAPEDAPESWSFRITPYFWAASLEGNIGIDNLPEADVDASFGDLLENLDWAAALFATARKGRSVVLADFSYTALEADDQTAGTTIDIDTDLYWVTLAVGMTVAEDASSRIDLFAGARYTEIDNDVAFTGGVNTTRGRNEHWIDPLVGLMADVKLSENLSLNFLLDFAGFGVGSDLTTEIMPTLGWRLGDSLSLNAGYRWLDTDYEDSDFEYDMTQHGLILGLGIGF